jgi:hypothetical protein
MHLPVLGTLLIASTTLATPSLIKAQNQLAQFNAGVDAVQRSLTHMERRLHHEELQTLFDCMDILQFTLDQTQTSPSHLNDFHVVYYDCMQELGQFLRHP